MTENSLNITDIADAVKIIDYAAEEGAFKSWKNIRAILAVRDKLEMFVLAAQNAAQNVNKSASVLDETNASDSKSE
jgi:hypothetical protein